MEHVLAEIRQQDDGPEFIEALLEPAAKFLEQQKYVSAARLYKAGLAIESNLNSLLRLGWQVAHTLQVMVVQPDSLITLEEGQRTTAHVTRRMAAIAGTPDMEEAQHLAKLQAVLRQAIQQLVAGLQVSSVQPEIVLAWQELLAHVSPAYAEYRRKMVMDELRQVYNEDPEAVLAALRDLLGTTVGHLEPQRLINALSGVPRAELEKVLHDESGTQLAEAVVSSVEPARLFERLTNLPAGAYRSEFEGLLRKRTGVTSPFVDVVTDVRQRAPDAFAKVETPKKARAYLGRYLDAQTFVTALYERVNSEELPKSYFYPLVGWVLNTGKQVPLVLERWFKPFEAEFHQTQGREDAIRSLLARVVGIPGNIGLINELLKGHSDRDRIVREFDFMLRGYGVQVGESRPSGGADPVTLVSEMPARVGTAQTQATLGTDPSGTRAEAQRLAGATAASVETGQPSVSPDSLATADTKPAATTVETFRQLKQQLESLEPMNWEDAIQMVDGGVVVAADRQVLVNRRREELAQHRKEIAQLMENLRKDSPAGLQLLKVWMDKNPKVSHYWDSTGNTWRPVALLQ
ncbi:MAG: hypothetical protein WA029_24130, partial [Anaerolineae bacterium]